MADQKAPPKEADSEKVLAIPAPDLTSDVELSREQVDLIKRTVCKDATDDELRLFLQQCRRTKLDPFARQIYAVRRWDSRENRMVMQIQISIDGQRIVAERSKEYQGQIGPFWCGEDGEWKDVWLSSTEPRAAKVGVYRSGFREPITGIALWDEYVQTYKQKDTGKAVNAPMWKSMPSVMIAKCAESIALRRSFPMDLSGLYVTEEMPLVEKDGVIIEGETGEIISEPAAAVPHLQEQVAKKAEEAKAEVKAESTAKTEVKSEPTVTIIDAPPEDIKAVEPAQTDMEIPANNGDVPWEDTPADLPPIAPESEDDDPEVLEAARVAVLERLKVKFQNSDAQKQALAIRNFFVSAHIPMGGGTSVKSIIWSFNLARLEAIHAYLDSLEKASVGT